MLISGFFIFVTTPEIKAQGKFVDNEGLAGRISNSVHQKIDRRYNTMAISRIRLKDKTVRININELIDYSNVKIVRGRRFRVTDRSKLQLLLKEQRIQLSEFVSPNEYRELGMLLGVQLFIYGNVYSDALVLKALDVQNSQIIWAETFTLFEQNQNYDLLNEFSGKLIESFGQDAEQLKDEKIKKVSFWSVDSPRIFENGEVMDYMTVALSTQGSVNIVDRENLQLIYQEQKLNQQVFIDESQARRLGELYGVDAFMYGKISAKPDGSYLASLKLMSIFSGVIIWADLIKFSLPEAKDKGQLLNPFTKKIQKSGKRKSNSGQVALRGGVFVMGSNDPRYNAAPERAVRIKSFFIDIYETSNEEYLQFVETTGHRRPTSWKNGEFPEQMSRHPVVGVNWEDAKMYCQHVGKRLLTETEWEYAIRGSKGRKYPWDGIGFGPGFAVTRESGSRGSQPVNTRNRDVTPEGISQLAGNVREHVADYYKPYGSKSSGGKERVIRGASWAFGAFESAGFYRGHSSSNLAWPEVGIRCGRDI
jgi:formylglycine-generating enzyme required for sulfatase activity